MNDEVVEDVIDLNEKFLASALGGIEVSELATLNKLELRVDTTCHSLQVTGEILPSLEYLKLNDSIIGSFRDVGTSFKNVRVLHIARCELKEVQGIQAFEQLEELYISYNEIPDLFDISFCEHLQILDFEANNVSSIDNLYYLRRLSKLTDLNLKHNAVTKEFSYHAKIKENVPNLQILDDEEVGEDHEAFFDGKKQSARRQESKLPDSSASSESAMQQAIQVVMGKFKSLGLSQDVLLAAADNSEM